MTCDRFTELMPDYCERRLGTRDMAFAREHLEIVQGLLAGDAKAASRAMARHIRSGLKYWSRAVAR